MAALFDPAVTAELNEFYKEVISEALRYVGFKIGDRSVANDVVSEAFIELCRDWQKFQQNTDKRVKLYLYLKMAIDKHHQNTRKVISGQSLTHEDDHSENGILLEEERMEQETLLLILQKEINNLSPECRKIIQLVMDGKTITSIAEELSMTASHVRKIKAQTINRLRHGITKFSAPESSGPGHSELFTPKGSHLCIRMINGRLEVFLEQPDGTWVFSDGTILERNNLYIPSQSKWTSILAQLEKLINKSGLLEQELQDFFEAYPELLMEHAYSRIIPQAAIISDRGENLSADFVLVPADQLNFCKILELKLPQAPIYNKKRRGHDRFSGEFNTAIQQIRDYHNAFYSPVTCQLFQNKYQTNMFRPDLHLVIGRRNQIKDNADFLCLQRDRGVKITDWDTIQEQMKKQFM